MESKKAEEFIMKHRECMLDNEAMGITCYAAQEAVEIAEEEMKQRCIEAHCKMCRTTSNVTPNCKGCTFKEEFLKLISK